MPKEIPMELKAKALEMLKTTDLNTVSRELHIYRRTLRLWANESGIPVSDPPRHEYYYSSAFKKEVVDYCREHGIDATMDRYPMSKASLKQWIKDAEPIPVKDTPTAPTSSIYPDDTMFTYDDEWKGVPIVAAPTEKETGTACKTPSKEKGLKGIIVCNVTLESGIEFQANVKGSDINQFESWIKSVSGIKEYNIIKATSTIPPFTRKKTKLSAARIAAGLTQEKLALKLGVTATQIQRWEYGIFKPKVATLLRMSTILGVPLEDLVEDE